MSNILSYYHPINSIDTPDLVSSALLSSQHPAVFSTHISNIFLCFHCTSMGRAKCFHCRHIHFHSNIFDISSHQSRCAKMGSTINRRLDFVSPLISVVDYPGYGFRYDPHAWIWFYLMTLLSGAIFLFITSSAPNQRALGTTNGISQTTVSIARAIGPALASSSFSFSVEKNILGGMGVYVVFAILSLFALYFATCLPSKLWNHDEPKSNIDNDWQGFATQSQTPPIT